jgi:hypothetical protein
MHYIKCTHCNKLNLFRTEYLTFCDACGKKLVNNYPDWKLKNHGKSLEVFRTAVCVQGETEQDFREVPKTKRSFLNKKSIIIGLGILAGISVIVTFSVVGPKIVETAVTYVQNSGFFREKWEKATYGQYGFVLETPGKLTQSKLEIPAEAQALIADMTVYELVGISGLKLYANSLKYRPEVGEANITNAANGAVSNIQLQGGLTDVQFSETPFGKSGVPGIRLDGTGVENGVAVSMLIVIFCRDLNLWQVSISWPSTSENLKRDAERIVESIKIDYNPNLKAI